MRMQKSRRLLRTRIGAGDYGLRGVETRESGVNGAHETPEREGYRDASECDKGRLERMRDE